jgi:N-acetylglucosaminyl-diphospho-decaprenol L-rhamnosyltransferase
MELSFCVVNTDQRALLLRGLDAIGREREGLPFASEVLVLDNASLDGSAQAARAHGAVDEVLALERRTAKSINDSTLMQRARGRFALLLNEDSELQPGATLALWRALESRPDAGAAGAALLRPGGDVAGPSAWRFPGPSTALSFALGMQGRWAVQSGGSSGEVRAVDWAQSSALLVRVAAARSIGWMDPTYFVYSDEVDFALRLRGAGWRTLHVPAARAVHHEQLSTGSVPERRIVEMSRNRDHYMRAHHGPGAARAVRWLTAFGYAERALAALVLPGHDPRRYWRHVTATLRPGRGEGLREAAEAFNRERTGIDGGAAGGGGLPPEST